MSVTVDISTNTIHVDPITLSDLTIAQINGTGVFDVLMQAANEHLQQEFKLGRIKGTEYATVYLGSLEHVLRESVNFLLQKDKQVLDALLIAKQIELADVEKLKVEAELALVQAQLPEIQAKVQLLGAQTSALTQKTPVEVAHVQAQTGLVSKQTLTEEEQAKVLIAQECKLRAEYDVMMENKLKTAEERQLLIWKTNTEKAQTTGAGVDSNSVIGKQKQLYQAQADGFQRDAEQKAAKVMVDSWNVRRTTDSTGVDGNGSNNLSDASVGRAVSRLLTGVGA